LRYLRFPFLGWSRASQFQGHIGINEELYRTVETMTYEFPVILGLDPRIAWRTSRLSSSNTVSEATDPRVEPEDDERGRVDVHGAWY